jgi:mannose-1-phosphate guanylyltransferase/mannose-6-phosphate isomerase
MSIQLQPVILCGGSGTRLWPLSREQYPKQLLSLMGERTLLQDTAQRLNELMLSVPIQTQPIVVCNQEYRFITAEQLYEVGVTPSKIILEPFGRNTAPALTLAALSAVQNNNDPILLVMASDHVMQSLEGFHQAIQMGLNAALAGQVVTFGIKANSPETGYGYIHADGKSPYEGVGTINAFVEKPDVVTAQAYVDSGEYLWNSGIFMLKASVWVQALTHFAPIMVSECEAALRDAHVDLDFIRIDETAFARCPSDSIDYAVMERLQGESALGIQGYVVPMAAGWSDVGTWSAVWDALDKDGNGNVAHGAAVFERTSNTLVHSEHRVVSCLGLDDLVIVDTADALLVAKKSEVHDLKPLVAQIKAEHTHLTEKHRKVFRPWGSYDSIDADERFQVKRITVKPGASLSLQMHHHRAEHWIVVSGTGKVTRGDEVFLLSENESTYIPLGVTHRLENPGKTTLELIEVQSGSYLGEDDIVRFDDIYGRDD